MGGLIETGAEIGTDKEIVYTNKSSSSPLTSNSRREGKQGCFKKCNINRQSIVDEYDNNINTFYEQESNLEICTLRTSDQV